MHNISKVWKINLAKGVCQIKTHIKWNSIMINLQFVFRCLLVANHLARILNASLKVKAIRYTFSIRKKIDYENGLTKKLERSTTLAGSQLRLRERSEYFFASFFVAIQRRELRISPSHLALSAQLTSLITNLKSVASACEYFSL